MVHTKNRLSRLAGHVGMGLMMLVLVFGIYMIQGHIAAGLAYWWDKVGLVMLGLLPLTVALVMIAIYAFIGATPRPPWMATSLRIISFAAPSLGLLGTVLGTVAGTASFSLANGVEDLLEGVANLMSGLNVALLSTAWGTLLGIPAGVMSMVLFPDPEENKSSSDHHEEEAPQRSTE